MTSKTQEATGLGTLKTVIVVFVAIFILAGLQYDEILSKFLGYRGTAYITASQTPLRSASYSGDNVIRYLPVGDTVKVTYGRGSWWRVRHNGDTGYIFACYLRKPHIGDYSISGGGSQSGRQLPIMWTGEFMGSRKVDIELEELEGRLRVVMRIEPHGIPNVQRDNSQGIYRFKGVVDYGNSICLLISDDRTEPQLVMKLGMNPGLEQMTGYCEVFGDRRWPITLRSIAQPSD